LPLGAVPDPVPDDFHPVPPRDSAARLQWLVDRALVVETVYMYATAVDSRDWELYRSIFTDEVSVDFSSFFGGGESNWVTMPADAWVESVAATFAHLGATQHSMSNPRVSIDGDRATCAMYVQAEHFRATDATDPPGGAPASYTVGGAYTDTLVRTAAGWRLHQVRLTVRWERGDKAIMTP
jgi:hypothetical protein